MRLGSRARLACLLLVGVACAGAAPLVELGAGWPDQAPAYQRAHERWTRRATDHDGPDHVITVAATAKTPEWRAAYVAERARRLELTAAEREALEASERKAAEEHLEFELLVATRESPWNDLGKWPSSMWRVALVGAGDREVLPVAIEEDRRTRAEIDSWFPDFAPFYEAYVVKFPLTGADGEPLVPRGAEAMHLRVTSALGGVELTWQSK